MVFRRIQPHLYRVAKRTKPEDTAAPLVPAHPSIPKLRKAAAGCRACDLWRRGTQTVFGEGLPEATLMLVGEQPGDREDLEGRPFVGPAGGLLDKMLAAAGIDRREVYITNVVKHFKWEGTSGKRRLHAKPNQQEITACRPWLDAEVAVVRPRVIVCLGATAAQALLGRDFKVTQRRGEWITEAPLAPLMMATVHPSSILRQKDSESRHAEMARFLEDLRRVAEALHGGEYAPQG